MGRSRNASTGVETGRRQGINVVAVAIRYILISYSHSVSAVFIQARLYVYLP
jgi:hypothetical protein